MRRSIDVWALLRLGPGRAGWTVRGDGASLPRRMAARCAAAACLALTAGCSSVPQAVNPVSWYDGARDALFGAETAADGAAQPADQSQAEAAEVPAGPSGLVADRENARHTGQVAVNRELMNPPPRPPSPKPLLQMARAESVAETSPPPQAPATALSPPPASEPVGKAADAEPAPDEDRDHFTVPVLSSRPSPPPEPQPERPAPSREAVSTSPLPSPATENEPYPIARPPLRTEAFIGGTAEASIPPDMRRPVREPFGPGSKAPVGASEHEATGGATSIDVTGGEIRRPPLRTERYVGGTAESATRTGEEAGQDTDDREAAPPMQTARPEGRLIPDVPPISQEPAAEPPRIPPPAQAPIERVSPSDQRGARIPDVPPATGIAVPEEAPSRPAYSPSAMRTEPPPPPPELVVAPGTPPGPPQLAKAVDGPEEKGTLAPQPLDGVVFGAPPSDIDPTATPEFEVGGKEPAPEPQPKPVQVAAAVDFGPDRVPVSLSELVVQPVDDPSRIASVLFDNGSAQLDEEARGIVEQVARLHKAEGGQLRIVGHASSRTRDMPMIRHRMVNLQLSMQRAQVVVQALNRLGVPNEQMSIEAVSDSDPVLREVMPAAEGPNRRTEIFLER